ncbi:MAG: DUF4974 domain-containing protein [Spirosomataceae bacterium]
MKDYTDYDVEALARDEYFRTSVLSPVPESESFWKSWLAAQAAHRETYEQAKILVIALHQGYKDTLSEQEIEQRVRQITARIPDKLPKERLFTRRLFSYWQQIAAVLVIGAGLSWWLLRNPQSGEMLTIKNQKALEEVMADAITKVNSSDVTRTFILSDSSIVTLSPGSGLRFPADFNTHNRTVTMTGEAFFEVSHHPEKPFLVYAGPTVTKVLGTGFRISAYAKSPVIKVLVKTGKVSVFKVSEFDPTALQAAVPGAGMILLPNQSALFHKATQTFQAKAKEFIASVETAEPAPKEFIFDDTPVSEVFKQLERQYGLDIEFDEKKFASCPITTTFREESLMERVNTICQAVGASYKPVDGKIVISGNGCHY